MAKKTTWDDFIKGQTAVQNAVNKYTEEKKKKDSETPLKDSYQEQMKKDSINRLYNAAENSLKSKGYGSSVPELSQAQKNIIQGGTVYNKDMRPGIYQGLDSKQQEMKDLKTWIDLGKKAKDIRDSGYFDSAYNVTYMSDQALENAKKGYQSELDSFNASKDKKAKTQEKFNNFMSGYELPSYEGAYAKDRNELEDVITSYLTIYDKYDEGMARNAAKQKAPEIMRRTMFDNVYGKGSYDNILNSADQTEIDAMNKQADYLQEQFDKYNSGEIDQDQLYAAITGDTTGQYNAAGYLTLQDQIDLIQREQDSRKKYTDIMETEYAKIETPNAQYVPENDKATNFTMYLSDMAPNMYTDKSLNTVYSVINNGNYLAGVDEGKFNIAEYGGHAVFMNYYPGMTEKFNELYNYGTETGDMAPAQAFYDAVQPYLNEAYAKYTEEVNAINATQYPILSSVQVQANNIINSAKGIISVPMEIINAEALGKEGDPYSDWYREARYNNTINQIIPERIYEAAGGGFWGNAARIGYLAVNEGVRNYIEFKLGGALASGFGEIAGMSGDLLTSKFGQNLVKALSNPNTITKLTEINTLAMMGNQIGQTSLAQGMTEDDTRTAYRNALKDIFVEIISEIGPVSTLAEKAPGWAKYATMAMEEPGEELFGGILDPIVDKLMNGSTEYERRADEILFQGGYIDENGNTVMLSGTDEEKIAQAKEYAQYEYNKQVTEAMITAFLSVGVSGGARAVGQNIKNQGDVRSLNNQITNNNRWGEFVDASSQLDLGEANNTLIANAKNKLANGQTLSRNERFNIIKAVANSGRVNSMVQNAAINEMTDQAEEEIRNEIAQNGTEEQTQLTDDQIRSAAEAVAVSAILGKNAVLSEEQKQALGLVPQAESVMKNFVTEEGADTDVTKQIKASAKNQVAGLYTGVYAAAGLVNNQITPSYQGVGNVATEDALNNATGTRTNSAGEAVVDGQIAEINGIQVDADGNPSVIVKVGDETRTADRNEVAAVNPTMASVIEFVYNNQSIANQQFATSLVNAVRAGNVKTDVDAFINEASRARIDAYLGRSMQTKFKSMDTATAQAIYDAAVVEARDADNARAATPTRNSGSIRISYMDADGNSFLEGSEEYNEKMNNLDRQTRTEIEALSEIGKRIGVSFDFNERAGQDVYGAYRDGTITINPNATADRAGTIKRSLMLAAGHEITHHIENNSPEAYKALRNFVIDELTRNGMDVNARVKKIMDTYNAFNANQEANTEDGQNTKAKPISINEAIAEIVADSCDRILSNKATIDNLANNNKGLFNQIRSAVKNFVDKIMSATRNMKTGSSVYNSYISNTKQLAKLWNIALDETMTRTTGATNTVTTETEAQNSLMEQVKNADTFEEAVNALPVQPQFSLASTFERKTGNLLAVHTISVQNFMRVLDLGAFADPSIAIIKNDFGFTGFGEISIVFDRSTIDPMADSRNRVYGRDVSSPTFPKNAQGMTVNQISDIMNQAPQKGRGTTDYAKAFFFGAIRNYQNLDEIRNDAGRIDSKSQGLFDYEKTRGDFNNVVNEAAKNSDMTAEEIAKDLAEISLVANTNEDRVNAIREKYGDDIANMCESIINTVQAMPTKYLEAKPMRVVDFGEMVGVTFKHTDGTSALENRLISMGITYTLHDGTNEDRIEKLNSFGTQFSLNMNDTTDPVAEMKQGPAKTAVRLMNTLDTTDLVNSKEFNTAINKILRRNAISFGKNTPSMKIVSELYDRMVQAGQMDYAKKILTRTMMRNEGIFMFDYLNDYSAQVSKIAKAIKISDMAAVSQAAQGMARLVPENSVLVPMPNHYGMVTDTGFLARAISDLTGMPVVEALGGEVRPSMYESKKNGKKPTAADLKMKQTMKLPRGKNIVIIDNVVSTGTSAQAAIQALGGKASVISYAKGRAKKSVISGLKTTRIETDLFGLIPLDRRGNKANPDVKYSLAGMSSVEYAQDISMAAEMHQRGATNSNIYKATGCIPGFRGKWWKVIDTTADGLNKSINISIKNTKTYTMEKLYSNEDLYKAYPDLKNVTVTVGGNVINTPGAAGAYDPDTGTIKINSMDQNNGNAKQKFTSYLMHEVQHWIQEAENSDQGANPYTWEDIRQSAGTNQDYIVKDIEDVISKYDDGFTLVDAFYNGEQFFDKNGKILNRNKKIRDMLSEFDPLDRQRVYEAMTSLSDIIRITARSPFDLYRNTVGEIEARAAAKSVYSPWTADTVLDYRNAVTTADYINEDGTKKYPRMKPMEFVDGGYQYSIQEAYDLDAQESDDNGRFSYGNHQNFSLRVTDNNTVEFLENQEHITTYRAMQLFEGRLYPPMAAIAGDKREDYSVLGEWDQSTEHPELAVPDIDKDTKVWKRYKTNGKPAYKMKLQKGGKKKSAKGWGDVDAAYNPYMHSSNLMINDQFEGAYNRPQLVTVECVVPSSELTSGYWADLAKDGVGWHEWKSGTSMAKITEATGTERNVFLSRWIKPVRIIPNAEVAQHYKDIIGDSGVAIRDTVVPPQLLDELIKAGVNIEYTDTVADFKQEEAEKEARKKAKEEARAAKKKAQEEAKEARKREKEAKKSKAQYSVQEAFYMDAADSEDGGRFDYGNHSSFSLRVTDRNTIDFLDNQEHITTYRAMQYYKGHLYPPMAAIAGNTREDYSVIGEWEQSVEHPELAIPVMDDETGLQKNYKDTDRPAYAMKLKKSDENSGEKGWGDIQAAYNPYMHSSNLMINDQFDGAYNRPQLVTVECIVPVSEATSGYLAQYAKDATGWHEWKSGTVMSKINKYNGTERNVFLSRWIKPVRIISDAEVAQQYKDLIGDSGIKVPDSRVSPGLLAELKKAGVEIEYVDKVQQLAEDVKAGKAKAQSDMRYSIPMDIVEAADAAMPDTKVRDAYGNLIELYHGTDADFTVFDREKIGKRGKFEGAGFNFTPWEGRAKGYGTKNVMHGFANVINPLNADRKTITVAKLAKIIREVDPTGDNLIADYAADTRDYGKPSFVNRESVTTAKAIWEYNESDVDLYSDISAYFGDPSALIDYFKEMGYDGAIHYNDDGSIKTVITFDSNQFKSADGTTLDDNDMVIPISKRFDFSNADIRYSLSTEEENSGTVIDVPTQSAFQYSRATWMASSYVKYMKNMAKLIAKNVLEDDSQANIEKAMNWIMDVNSVASIIGGNANVLDYVGAAGRSAFKSNTEYGGSIDMSLICAKRRLLTGTIDAIQRAFPEMALTEQDYLEIRSMMKTAKHEVSCGLCYVESSRKNIGKYAKQFLNEWNKNHPDIKLNMVDVNTVMGLENIRTNPEVYGSAYEDYVAFMNRLAQRKPKLFETRAEYQHEILERFKNDSSVEDKNRNGGLRINSFSDFEIVHAIDMMQVIMDMSVRGLNGQAYTKVKEFAEILGGTGLKINLSMITKGLDENGKIIFDEVEGMKWEDAQALRDKYADNVGTILVVFTDDQLASALNDDRIDFIIPFHRSQWKKSNYADLGLPENTKDFTMWQNEKYIVPVERTTKFGKKIKERPKNYMPNEYWDFSLTGKENAERYLEMCAQNNRRPKFDKLLVNNGDGSYSLQPDGSTDGYWKLLIDFKMYNHLTGVGAAQMPVMPNFDMTATNRILKEYQGGHETFPVAQDIVDQFVNGRKGASVNKGKVTLAGPQLSIRTTDASVTDYMDNLTEDQLDTESEKNILRDYNAKKTEIQAANRRIMMLEADLASSGTERRQQLRQKIDVEKKALNTLRDEMAEITTGEGYAAIMARSRSTVKNFLSGKTQTQVMQSATALKNRVDVLSRDIADLSSRAAALEKTSAIANIKKYFKGTKLNQSASYLRKTYGSTMRIADIENAIAGISLKMVSGDATFNDDIQELAGRIIETMHTPMSDEDAEVLAAIRGTWTVSKGQWDELMSAYDSAKNLKKALAGTGVSFKKARIDSEANLDGTWTELCRATGYRLTEDTVDGDEPGALISLATTIRDNANSQIMEQYGYENIFNTVGADIISQALELSPTVDTSPEGMKLVKQAVKEIKGDTSGTELGVMIERIEQLQEELKEVRKVAGETTKATNQIGDDAWNAIRYYDSLAKAQKAQMDMDKLNATIRQIESDAAQKLMDEQKKWQDILNNNKAVWETMRNIEKQKKQIATIFKRYNNLLVAETDTKNIPEKFKSIVWNALRPIINHEMISTKRITDMTREQLKKDFRYYQANENAYGSKPDLTMLVDLEGNVDEDLTEAVMDALEKIAGGIYAFDQTKGYSRIAENVAKDSAALAQIQEGMDIMNNMVRAARETWIQGKRTEIQDLAQEAVTDAMKQDVKGQWASKTGKTIDSVGRFVKWGNMTPVYFFKNLKNGAFNKLFKEMTDAENRYGLLLQWARGRMDQIQAANHYGTWDVNEIHEITLENGDTVELTTEQIMSLLATWKRELNTATTPEDSQHIMEGGFVYRPQVKKGKVVAQLKEHYVKASDFSRFESALTAEQLAYMDQMVEFISKDMGALGNEGSMKMFGIKKFTESYYFPFKVWRSSLAKSSTSGSPLSPSKQNAAARQGFTKRRRQGARNPIMLENFTDTVAQHVNNQIVYNTMAPAVEGMNKVLNAKTNESTQEGGEIRTSQRNVETVFTERYGTSAQDYLRNFMADVNGSFNQDSRKTFSESLLSLFKKNAVAGSLSVALQQPLSYIRAANMIDPKYLASALSPTTWKGSYAEMMKYSGVAVIKDMGRFDMNLGQSGSSYIRPEAKVSKGRAVYDTISDKSTILPELMDRMTWTRMWSAVKAEQHAQNPGMDMQSEEFLKLVADRFNDLMRYTQVYDSIMVKSSNMRSQRYAMKVVTSFMAEPTLSANLLADALANAKGFHGKRKLAEAIGTFILSAILQAIVKGVMSSLRSPDEKKTFTENFIAKWWYNFSGEINPMNLIPGYSEMIDVLSGEDITDNAYGVLSNIVKAAVTNPLEIANGKSKGAYRDMEDTMGQLAQIFTGVPVKNLMRDGRAMYNAITQPYAQRETSPNVVKYTGIDALVSEDLPGVINGWLQKAGYGYGTTTTAYYDRIYAAKVAGNENLANEMTDYLVSGKGVKQESIDSKMKSMAKADYTAGAIDTAKMTDIVGESGGTTKQIWSTVKQSYMDGTATRAEAENAYKAAYPDATKDDIYFALDPIDYEISTGKKASGDYYRMNDAIQANSSTQITSVVNTLMGHGKTKSGVKSSIETNWKEKYIQATTNEKVVIKDGCTKALKAAGYTQKEIEKMFKKWK